MDRSADRLESAADLVAAVHRSVPALTVSAGAFAADDAGLPGSLGRRLHTHWTAVLSARADEAAEAAARLTDLADALRCTERHYADTDRSVGRRVERRAR
jgi:hypothetical protein